MAKKAKLSRGPAHWIHHGKVAFFSRRQGEWAKAKQNGHLQSFAADMAHAYEIRYGHLASLNDDLPDHATPEMPSDDELAAHTKQKALKLAALSQVEQEKEKENSRKFREKILKWYREHRPEKTAGRSCEVADVLSHIFKHKPRPRRGQVVQTFCNLYWDEGVGEAVSSAYWNLLTSDARSAGDDEAASLSRLEGVGSAPVEDDEDDDKDDDEDDSRCIAGVVVPDKLIRYDPKKTKFLSLLNSIGHELYEKASDEQKKKVGEEIEERYQRRLDAYNKVKKPVCDYTPDDYAVALEEGANYITKVARAFAVHFGMACSIVLVGPDDKGVPTVRSCHAGRTKVTGCNFPDFDATTWNSFEAGFVRFGKKVFPDGNFRRDLATEDDAEDITSPDAIPSSSKPSKKTKKKRATSSNDDDSDSSTDDDTPLAEQIKNKYKASNNRRETRSMATTPSIDSRFEPFREFSWELNALGEADLVAATKELTKMSLAELERQNTIVRSNWRALAMGYNCVPSVFTTCRRLPRSDDVVRLEAQLQAILQHEYELEKAEDWPVSTDIDLSDLRPRLSSYPPSDPDIDPPASDVDAPAMDVDPPNPPTPAIELTTSRNSRKRSARQEESESEDDFEKDNSTLAWDDVDSSGWSKDVEGMFAACKRIRDVSPLWLPLVHSVIVFERRHGFPGRLEAKMGRRPKTVVAFFKNAHSWKREYGLGESTAKHKDTWWDWWRSLQPDSRFRRTR